MNGTQLSRLRDTLGRLETGLAVYDNANGTEARVLANMYRDDISALRWAINLAERADTTSFLGHCGKAGKL